MVARTWCLGGLGSTAAMERRGETQLVLNSKKIILLQILAWGGDTAVPTSQKQLLSISGQSQIHSLSVSILCNCNLCRTKLVGTQNSCHVMWQLAIYRFLAFVLFAMTLNVCMHLLMLLTNPFICHHVQLSLLLSCSISFLLSFHFLTADSVAEKKFLWVYSG